MASTLITLLVKKFEDSSTGSCAEIMNCSFNTNFACVSFISSNPQQETT